MLKILGQPIGLCDRLSRRNFLQIGGLALGGLSMPQLLRAEAAAKVSGHGKGIIMVFLPGGPPHQDMWDLKMDAPKEIRGEFNPIQTKVGGIEIGELFPRMAEHVDSMAFIHSCHSRANNHAPASMEISAGAVRPGYPSLGSWVTYGLGSVSDNLPAFVVMHDAKPRGAVRLELFYMWLEAGQKPPKYPDDRARYLRSYTRTPIEVEFPVPPRPMLLVYWGRWADSRGEVGPFSPAVRARPEGWSEEPIVEVEVLPVEPKRLEGPRQRRLAA